MSPLLVSILYFLAACLVVSVVCAAVRERDAGKIAREAFHFFTWMVAGITAFSAVIWVLEWVFIRRL